MIEQINTEETEICVSCGEPTTYKRSDHIDYRFHYIEGVGQLCSDCNPTRLIDNPEWYY